MTERAGWKAPVWTYEQASSHRMHPVHRSGVIRSTFMAALSLLATGIESWRGATRLPDRAITQRRGASSITRLGHGVQGRGASALHGLDPQCGNGDNLFVTRQRDERAAARLLYDLLAAVCALGLPSLRSSLVSEPTPWIIAARPSPRCPREHGFVEEGPERIRDPRTEPLETDGASEGVGQRRAHRAPGLCITMQSLRS